MTETKVSAELVLSDILRRLRVLEEEWLDQGDWTHSDPVGMLADLLEGAGSQPVLFDEWCAQLDAHHEHLRQTEDGFEGYGDGSMTAKTGADCWAPFYAAGTSPADALAEDRDAWND